MKLLRLHLKAFGPFTDRLLDLSPGGQRLVLVHGPNEAGKSSTLRAISALRYGIDHVSVDNFIHDYRKMRIGGVFEAADGSRHGLMRRKGRQTTRTLTAFDPDAGPGVGDEEPPAAPAVERLLGAGLSKDEHEALFALDHQRLRDGGRALLEGRGELGAALFEASSGVRSVPALLERLDQSARRWFVPRGSKGRINEALRDYEQHHKALREATVTPHHWAGLRRRHDESAAALAQVEAAKARTLAELLLVKELRAVAPLLGAIGQGEATLAELADAPLLAAEAPAARVGAETALAESRHGARLAAEDGARAQARLDDLRPDDAAMEAAAAIERLGAAAEAVETLRADQTRAVTEAGAAQAAIDATAARIDAGAGAAEVLARAPAPAARAAVDEALAGVEKADRALEHHLAVPPPALSEGGGADTAGGGRAVLPSPEQRTTLRAAVREATRIEATLARLDAMPGEIARAGREAGSALAAIGVAGAAALDGMRPLLDAEIDAVLRRHDAREAREADLRRRLREMADARDARRTERDELLAAGAVPTRDDVLAARVRRDAAWRQWHTFVGSPSAGTVSGRADAADGRRGDAAATAPVALLAEVFEFALDAADRLADDLARDSARAARLQACADTLRRLDTDIALREEELAAVAAEARDDAADWSRRLAGAGLPEVAPRALREWQGRLATASRAVEALQQMREEECLALAQRQAVAQALRAALRAGGLAVPADEIPLATLSALALQAEETQRQQEKRLDTAAGQREERERRRREWLAREDALRRALDDAREAARPALLALRLPADAGAAVARARLAEFDQLRSAQSALDEAVLRLARSRDALAALQRQSDDLGVRLGHSAPDDVRRHADALLARLADARQVDSERRLAAQAVRSADEARRRHDAATAHQQALLDALCAAASVEAPRRLPEAEQRSQRRREAQAALDAARAQLARASRHPHDALLGLLAERDPAALGAEEEAGEHALAAFDAPLRAARVAEEAARRELEAIDGADTAAAARERMEQAAAGVRDGLGPWMRSRLAHALLAEATRRFRERAQGPMLKAASAHFGRMTGGEFVRLLSDEAGQAQPVLLAERRDGRHLGVEALSEGTCDQLYLALRLAALELRRAAGVDLPVVLDDVLMTSDDHRAGLMLQALADFARGGQVIVFTHHAHLAEVARRHVEAGLLSTVEL